MTFFRPTAMFWAVLAVPVVILYLRRFRAPVVPVSTGFLWDEVVTAGGARQRWRRWREGVSLGVQLAVLGVLVLGAAEPYLRPPHRTVLVIDNSATMNAVDVEPARLARAKALARRELAALGYRDEMAVVSGGEPVEIHVGLTGRRETLEAAIAGVAPGKGPSRAVQAVARARVMLAEGAGGQGKIVVLSDGCFDGSAELADAPDVRFVAVGGAGDNVAVTALAARRAVADPRRCQVLAEVTSFASEPVDCRLTFELADRPIGTASVHLAPGARWQQVFELEAGRESFSASAASARPARNDVPADVENDVLRAALDRADAFPEDNAAFVLLPESGVRRVILVGPPEPYLAKALESNPRVRLTLADAPPAQLDPGTILVLHRRVPETIPDGPVLVIDPANSCPLWQLGEALDDPLVAGQQDDSPLVADVSLHGACLAGARRMTLAEAVRADARPVAWNAGGQALIYEMFHAGGRMVVLGGSLEAGDLPQHIALPVLVANAVAWLSGELRTEACFRRDAAVEGAARRATDIRVPDLLRGKTDPGPIASSGTAPWVGLVAVGLAMLVLEWGLYQRRWIC